MRMVNFSWLVPVLLLALSGCDTSVPQQQSVTPVAFHDDDECHVCGMTITRFPGPKGQAMGGQMQGVRKFCSSAEMLGWYLQPEHRHAGLTLYVHDMAKSRWDMPDDAHLVDASQAFFVPAPDLPSAMGMTLASFADKQAAQDFAEQHNSQVMDLNQAEALLKARQDGSETHHGHH